MLPVAPPNRPPDAGAAVAAGCFAPKRPPEELPCGVCEPPKSPDADGAVVVGCEEGAEVEAPVFAAPPNRLEAELWPVLLPKSPELPVLPLSLGGGPAGVVDSPIESNGFAGVAVGAANVVPVWPPVVPCVLLPNRPPLPLVPPPKRFPDDGAVEVFVFV